MNTTLLCMLTFLFATVQSNTPTPLAVPPQPPLPPDFPPQAPPPPPDFPPRAPEMVFSSDLLLYTETIFVIAASLLAKFVVEPRLKSSVPVELGPVPCAVYFVLVLTSGSLTALVISAVTKSFQFLGNAAVNLPLIVGSCVEFLRVAERLSENRLLLGPAKGFVTARGLLSLVVVPWLLRILDDPRITPALSLTGEINNLPGTLQMLLFVGLPLILQTWIFGRNTRKQYTFASGVLASITMYALIGSLFDDLGVPSEFAVAVVMLVAALLATMTSGLAWSEGFTFSGTATSIIATFYLMTVNIFPISIRITIMYAIIMVACGTLLRARSKTKDNTAIIGSACFVFVIFTNRIATAILTELMGETIVGYATSGLLGIAALYYSYVTLAPATL